MEVWENLFEQKVCKVNVTGYNTRKATNFNNFVQVLSFTSILCDQHSVKSDFYPFTLPTIEAYNV